jgi:DNA-binding Xre family transcriptional regulator
MDMRLRFPELFTETGVNPYRLSTRSGNRISLSTAYRLKRVRGVLETYRSAMLDAICDVMEVTPAEIWEREPAPKPDKAPTKPKATRPSDKPAV